MGVVLCNGNVPLNCWRATGKPVERNRLVPVHLMQFLERMFVLTGERKYRTAADRAFVAVEKGPLTTWNWEGQFEDVKPSERFRNLTKHDACSTAMYLLKRFPGDARRLAQAREFLRFAEDQFVCWERQSSARRVKTGTVRPSGSIFARTGRTACWLRLWRLNALRMPNKSR